MAKQSVTSDFYYNRTMDTVISDQLKENGQYYWMIQYVKDHPELDFQTGSNKNNSWFSVYRGTSKIIKIEKSKKKSKISYAKKYYDLCPEYYEDTTKSVHLDTLLNKLRADPNLSRYYGNESTGKKTEGYYQNLISCRYTFLNKPDDDFMIIDKEFVIGFRNEETKKGILKKIDAELKDLLENEFRPSLKSLRKNVATTYGEVDFLGLNWDGDLIIIELKGDNSQKIFTSPIQVGFYQRLLAQVLEKYPDLYRNIYSMLKQKVELGLITIPDGRTIPKSLSGKIKSWVIVGEEKKLSEEICSRYIKAKKIFCPDIETFTCINDGTLRKSEKLL